MQPVKIDLQIFVDYADELISRGQQMKEILSEIQKIDEEGYAIIENNGGPSNISNEDKYKLDSFTERNNELFSQLLGLFTQGNN